MNKQENKPVQENQMKMENKTEQGKQTEQNEQGEQKGLEFIDLKNAPDQKKAGMPLAAKIGIIVVILLLIIGAVVYFLAKNTKSISVETAKVVKGRMSEEISTNGQIQSEQSVTYYSPASVKVAAVNVKKGEAVTAGTKLIEFDSKKLQTEQEKLELNTQQKQDTYDQKLYKNAKNNATIAASSNDLSVLEPIYYQQVEYVRAINDVIARREYAVKCQQDGDNKRKIEYSQQISDLTHQIDEITFYDTQNNITGEQLKADQERKQQLKRDQWEIQKKSDQLALNLIGISTTATYEEKQKIAAAETFITELQKKITECKTDRTTSEKELMDQFDKSILDAGKRLEEINYESNAEVLEEASSGVTAEFNGVIMDVATGKGAAAAEGSKLIQVDSIDQVCVRGTVTKYDIEKIQIGQKAVITLNDISSSVFHRSYWLCRLETVPQ